MKNLVKIDEFCYECNGVTVRETASPSEYHIKFLNGEVDIRLDPRNPIALGTGVGAGKTTALCLIMILRMRYGGVAYVTNSVEDLNNIYYWFRDNVFGLEIRFPDGYRKFTCEDIFNLHNTPVYGNKAVLNKDGEYELSHEDDNIVNGCYIDWYRKDPTILRNYRILLMSSYKFTHEDPVNLFWVNNKISAPGSISRQQSAVTGLSNHPGLNPVRETLLIDEMISCDLLNITLKESDIKFLGSCVESKGYDYIDPVTNEIIHRGPIIQYFRPYAFEVIEMKYEALSECRPDLSISKSDPLKKKLILGTLYDGFDDILREMRNKGLKEYTVYNNVNSLILNGSRVSVLLAEGTAEYLFLDTIDERTGMKLNNNKFTLKTYPDKYNSPINIEIFDTPLPKRTLTKKELRDLIDPNASSTVEDRLLLVAKLIESIMTRDDVNKMLVFTWMNFKDEDEYSSAQSSIVNYEVNQKFDIIEYLRNRILSIPNGKEVTLSHYQSGKDVATNEFRDYDSIMFIGNFRIPNYAVDAKNRYYGYNATGFSYAVRQVIQAIGRTRIRNHRGEPINIFFSSDWPENIISEVERHLNNHKVDLSIVQKDTTLDWIPNKWRGKIRALMEYDPGFKYAIETRSSYRLEIGLDDIYKLIPMAYKEVGRYFRIIKYLKSINIELVISTNKIK